MFVADAAAAARSMSVSGPAARRSRHRPGTAVEELRCRSPAIPGDDPEGLAGGGSGRDQAHVGSRRSVFWPVDEGLDDTIR